MTNEDPLNETRLAYAQARAYGKDLARLYAAEKERRKELETTTKKLQAIFDMAPNGLAVVDNNLTVVEANPRFLTLFQTSTDCIGRPLADLLPIKDVQEAMQRIKNDSQSLSRVEIEISKPTSRTLLVNLAPLGDDHGWILIIHDLTERKRLEGLKDEFVNIAAHELRTPLAGVMGFVGVLQEELARFKDPMLNSILEMIMQSTERLRTTIDDLVEFATTNRTAPKHLSIAEIDLNRLLQKSVDQLQEKIAAENITCQVDLPAEGLTVRGDAYILDGIIYQLLSNAVKFNKPGGKIFIRARRVAGAQAVEHDLQPGTVIIEFEDTGIGIPETDLENIFDKFYQVEEHLTRATGGLGLGLTIARRGVEQHGGQLTVTSRLGEGSIFRIILPPISRLNEVSIDKRLDMIHRQMLTYARDMAQAVASERKIRHKMEQIHNLSRKLADVLRPLLSAQASASAAVKSLNETTLGQIRDILRDLLQLSAPEEHNSVD